MNTSLGRFVGLSLALHAIALLLLYFPLRPRLAPEAENIPVSLLPIPEKTEPAARAVPRAPRTRLPRTPAIIAKKDSPNLYAKPDKAPNRSAAREESRAPAPPAPAPAVAPEPDIIAERPLPSLKDLLPSANWSSSSARNSAPVSLGSRDPLYVSYFTRIKQLIDSQWEYPELARRYGLQGTLVLEFTIGASGRLEQLRLVRSSGSQLLDEEALRAIKAAAPFPNIPPWIKPNPLSISATMEYHDSRLDYRFNR